MGVRKKKRAAERRRTGGFKIKTRRDKKPIKERVRLPTAEARAKWDKERTLLENYESLGLAYDPNKVVTEITAERAMNQDELSLSSEASDDVEGKSYVHRLLAVPEPREKKAPNLGVRERVYMKNLYDKYGDNYDGMVRDVKLNTNQYTKKHLKKKVTIYIDYYKEKMEKQAATKAVVGQAKK